MVNHYCETFCLVSKQCLNKIGQNVNPEISIDHLENLKNNNKNVNVLSS